MKQHTLIAALTCLALGACEARREREDKSSAAPAAAHPTAPERSFVQITQPDEPGEPLEVSGRVFEPDGVTPAAGVVVYVYHTDRAGLYGREPDAPPRLRAWMVTDAEGRYRYRTIKPAPYPGSTIAAHVHTQLWSARFPPQYNTDLEFRDDPFLSAREIEHSDGLGTFAYIVLPERGADGVLRATHDLRLKTSGDDLEDNIRHGVDDAPPELKPR